VSDSIENQVQSAINAGKNMAEAASRIVNVGHSAECSVPVSILPAGMSLVVQERLLALMNEQMPTPKRRKGTATHHELASFVSHVNRFKDEHSAVFADIFENSITAVLNYHEKGDGSPRWGDHESVYVCPLSTQWKLWITHDGRAMTQEQFGEFIDANMADLASDPADGPIDPGLASPASLLQMARNLVVRTKGEFSRTINPTTGEGSLISKMENESTSTPIPRAFLLQLPVFEHGTVYRVEARVRFAMSNGRPTFAYVLYQPDTIKKDAFGEVREQVWKGTGLPVFAGRPEVVSE
jgi:uncharacterized protein YfdQ (DUF2303 family)